MRRPLQSGSGISVLHDYEPGGAFVNSAAEPTAVREGQLVPAAFETSIADLPHST
jgi:hypothetical protein